MISLGYLFEFHGIDNEMAFEAAKRLAKNRMGSQYDPGIALYRTEQTVKRMQSAVPDSASLADEDQVGVWSGKGAKSPGGKNAMKLLKKRFKQ
jgi:hypothetical protein